MHIDKIATAALCRGIPTRATMLEIMLKMCSEDGYTLTEYEQVTLYKFFSPVIPKTPKTDLQWVVLATSKVKNDGRPYLRAVQVLNGLMTATDGQSLHQAPTDMSDGYYDAMGQSVDMSDWTYPDVSRVIPSGSEVRHDWRRDDFTTQDATSKYKATKTNQVYVAPGWGMGFNAKLWDRALGILAEGVFTQKDASSPARFDLPGDRLVVLMPYRI